jgi:dipeptidyl aminopeptidase/acylaminoacyl peptidase
MCMLGASYGGYSSLVSAVRWPGRFRCAVSMAGVSDLALFFTASDSGRDAKTRELLEKIVGNPHTDMASMQRSSPLYNYEALRLPVMLVHGREDRRVDYEHTRRMLRMLDMAGNPPVGLVFDDEGHDLAGAANRIKAWEGVAGFLRSHLDAPAAATGAL